MSVGESILMTVYNREPEILLNTFRWLASCDLSDSEIIVVDDGSTMDYSWIDAYKGRFNMKWIKLPEYPAYRIDGFNNPARAFNAALQAAEGERVCLLSSDVIVPERVIAKARQSYDANAVWCPMTIDLATSAEYCGPHRVFPMPWFLYTSKAKCIEAGGWDENFLFGMCWEDNDFVGRLALVTERINCDWNAVCWHQSHYQPAYEIQNEDILNANQRSKRYITKKWAGGIPFGPPDMLALGMSRSRDEATGNFCLKFDDFKGVKDRVIACTLSPFVDPLVPENVGG